MHELSITQSVVDAILQRLGDVEISCVHLEIGRLSGVVADSVAFCFDLVTRDTSLQGARLDIIELAGTGRCRDCAAEFEVVDPIVLCPSCDGANVALLSGTDLRIKSVEVKDACVPPAAVPTQPGPG